MKKIILFYLVMFVCSFGLEATKSANLLNEAVYNVNFDDVQKNCDVLKKDSSNVPLSKQAEVTEMILRYAEIQDMIDTGEVLKKVLNDKNNNQDKTNTDRIKELKEVLDGNIISATGNFLRSIDGNFDYITKNDIKFDIKAKKELIKIDDKPEFKYNGLSQVTIENINNFYNSRKKAVFTTEMVRVVKGKEKIVKDYTKSGVIDKELFLLDMTKEMVTALQYLKQDDAKNNSESIRQKFSDEAINKTLALLYKISDYSSKVKNSKTKEEADRFADKLNQLKIVKREVKTPQKEKNNVKVKISINNDKIVQDEKTFLSLKVDNIGENEDVESYKIVGIDNFEILETESKRSENGFVRLFHIKPNAAGRYSLKCIFISNREAYESEEIQVSVLK